MSYHTDHAVSLAQNGNQQTAQVHASIAQAEALERIADALEALVNPNEAGS